MNKDKWLIENMKNQIVYSIPTKTLLYKPTAKIKDLDKFYKELLAKGYIVHDSRCIYFYS